jgi:hypothetical protein
MQWKERNHRHDFFRLFQRTNKMWQVFKGNNSIQFSYSQGDWLSFSDYFDKMNDLFIRGFGPGNTKKLLTAL